ncbi:MAG TPA: Gfo/Idh/MocA family oxidoreductase, partial [Virgibacillus sp.]|nr:Gfo/Idh/MocA family oxidoreductase [Virgibacillus sp.]
DAHGEKTVIIEDQKLPGAKFYYGASHTKLINRFYEAIRTKTNNYIHVKEGLMAMKMIDAIRTSSQKHQTITF